MASHSNIFSKPSPARLRTYTLGIGAIPPFFATAPWPGIRLVYIIRTQIRKQSSPDCPHELPPLPIFHQVGTRFGTPMLVTAAIPPPRLDAGNATPGNVCEVQVWLALSGRKPSKKAGRRDTRGCWKPGMDGLQSCAFFDDLVKPWVEMLTISLESSVGKSGHQNTALTCSSHR